MGRSVQVNFKAAEQRAKQRLEDYYQTLIEGCVVDAHMVECFGELWPVFTIKKDGKTFTLTLQRDEEGNGPGFGMINEF